MKDILNKALAANADTDAVAKVIDTVVNTPRQDVQPKTDKEAAIKHRLNVEEAFRIARHSFYGHAVEEALAKRYEALRKAVINVITEAIFGSISVDDATDDIIKLVTAGRIIDIEDAKLEHELGGNDKGAFEDGFEPISVANADANYVVNVDAAGKGKDKSDRRMFRKDANGRIFELRGVNNDAPDELY